MKTIIRNFSASLILMGFLLPTFAAQKDYQTTIKSWREKQEKQLQSDDGWLTVAGLFWLKEGSSTVGSAPASDILLPDTAPGKVGTIEFHNGKTRLHIESSVKALVNHKPVTDIELRADAKPKPDVVSIGDLSLQVIKRGGRYGIRLKDKNSRQRREFTGLRWFPVQEAYRIRANYFAYEKPKEIDIVNILGDVEKMKSPGYVIFAFQGREFRLEPVLSEEKLFFIFRDWTSGKTTYPAGRFLYADLPTAGKVRLDFNQAINPPCAFTQFATCPLPPPQNHLGVAIEAGEMAYHPAAVSALKPQQERKR